ncbi:hypothetical protein [Streptomyces sp. NPDC006368]|uniref:hypothetical protein n=1 Tax=Streptomyces sp. NPDC006368 TaxID=3156760 RepID=UPI0033A3A02D
MPTNGLCALKPWYADRPAGARGALARRAVSPDALTAAGPGCTPGRSLIVAGRR